MSDSFISFFRVCYLCLKINILLLAHLWDAKYSSEYFYRWKVPSDGTKKPSVPKKKLYLDTLAKIQKERELLAPTISSRKVMEPPPLRNVKHGWKSSGKSSPKIGMLYLHGHVWKKTFDFTCQKRNTMCLRQRHNRSRVLQLNLQSFLPPIQRTKIY